MVEHSLDKRAVNGSNPFVGTKAGIAQLVERLTCNQDVVGSNPAAGTKFLGGCFD